MPRRPRSRRRRSRICSPAATCSASPRPAPARPRPSRCRSCSASPPIGRRRRGARAQDGALPGADPDPRARLADSRQLSRLRPPSRAARDASIFGGVGQAPQVAAMARGVDILVATPGRLLDLIGQGHVRLDRRRDLRARRGRPHARHGLHPRRPKDRRAAAESAPDPAVLGDDAARHRPARRRDPRRPGAGRGDARRPRPSN